jgi:AcrR family transcriptional regulator
LRGHPDTWIEAAFGALVAGGVRAVRVESLARELGLTKGSFYHHFANRRALLDAMLAGWRDQGTDAIIAHVDTYPPSGRLRALLELSLSAHSGDAIEGAVRAWAASDAAARAVVDDVDARRVRYVADLLTGMGLPHDEALRRSRVLYRVVIGDAFWRASGGPPLDPDELAAVVRLFSPETTKDTTNT